jgi:hypothetical protein
VHQLTAKTFLNALFRHPPDITGCGADRHKIVQSTAIIAQYTRDTELAGLCS